MRAAVGPRLAWGVWALAVALYGAALLLAALNRDDHTREEGSFVFLLLFGLAAVAMGAIGALVAARRPGNAVGWILVVGSAVVALTGFAEEWAIHTLFDAPGALPWGIEMAWLTQWTFIPALVQVPALLLLLFPDGRLPGPRWRPALWLAVATTVTLAVASALAPGYGGYDQFEGVPGPFGLEGAREAGELLSAVGFAGTAVAIPIAAAAMIVRLRRSRGVERLQLKWIASASAIFALAVVAAVAGLATGQEWVAVFMILSFPLIPLSAGVAVLRHRLYDIDLVINRALVYGSLTALLAASYVGLVLLLGAALSPVTSGSDLAIALSTLAVAALFRPIRGRVQTLVDRRFYRHRYDAARTLERFASRLRAETDLEALRAELLGVVRESMAPAHVSLWLKAPRA